MLKVDVEVVIGVMGIWLVVSVVVVVIGKAVVFVVKTELDDVGKAVVEGPQKSGGRVQSVWPSDGLI